MKTLFPSLDPKLEKPSDVKIIDITAVRENWDEKKDYTVVYGVGDDGRVYKWDNTNHCWFVYELIATQ